MVWNAHLFSRFGEEMIVFGAAFSGARLGAVGACGQEISGNGEQEFLEEVSLLTGLACGGVDGIGEVLEAVESAL
jgi:hypothetical protein